MDSGITKFIIFGFCVMLSAVAAIQNGKNRRLKPHYDIPGLMKNDIGNIKYRNPEQTVLDGIPASSNQPQDEGFVFDLPPVQGQAAHFSFSSVQFQWERLLRHGDIDYDMPMLGMRARSQTACGECHGLAECQSGSCVCKDGFEGNGTSYCEDINECENSLACEDYQDCLNVYGSFHCLCKPGFVKIANLQNVTCVDQDECQEWEDICHAAAKCVNTIGSYFCSCPEGYAVHKLGECLKVKTDSIVECSTEEIFINITKAYLKNFKPAEDARKKNPNRETVIYLRRSKSSPVTEECTLQPSASGSSYTISIYPPFQSCSTQSVVDRSKNLTTIIYSNTIWWSNIFKGYEHISMPFKMLDIQCAFSEDSILAEVEASASIQDPQNTASKAGNPNITMKFWRFPPDRLMSDPSLSVPLDYAIGEVLYVTVELADDGLYPGNTTILLKDCFASSQPITESSKVAIITNGCPAPDVTFQHDIQYNGVARKAQFSFQMFHLQPSAGMFVNCEVLLSESKSPATCPIRRKRDSLNAQEKEKVMIRIGDVTVSQGPVTPYELPKTQKSEDFLASEHTPRSKVIGDNDAPTKSVVIPVMLVVANLSILCLLGLVSYTLARSVSAKRRARREEIIFGRVSISPADTENFTMTPIGGEETTPKVTENQDIPRLFCADSECRLMKEVKPKSRRTYQFRKKNQAKQSRKHLFEPTASSTSIRPCATPFNSPPLSPPKTSIVCTSVGTSPIRALNEIAPSRS